MKQVKLAQDEKREMLRIMDEVETMSEDSKKLLSPKGAIVVSEQISYVVKLMDSNSVSSPELFFALWFLP